MDLLSTNRPIEHVQDILQWQPDGGWVGELEAARSIQLGALKDWLAMEPEEQLEISLESFHQQAEQSMTNRRSILETSAYPASDDEAADGDASSLVSGDQMNDAINIAVANALDRASELFSYFEGQDLSPILVHGVQEVLAFERSLFGDDDTVQLDLIEAF